MYSKIDSRFWCDERVLALSADAMLLMVYLLTTPHRNVLGCYQLPKGYAMEDTHLPERRFKAAWNEVMKSGMATYDEGAKIVLIKNFLRYNPIENPNQAKGALTRLGTLPRCQLFETVAETLLDQINNKKEYLTPLLEGLAELLPNPSEALMQTLSERVQETVNETRPQPVNR